MAGQYAEGQRLQGSDGQVYVVRNGTPVPERAVSYPGAIVPPNPMRVQQQRREQQRQDANDARSAAAAKREQLNWDATHNPDGTPKAPPPVAIPGDPNLTGQDYLKTLPPAMRGRVQQLLDGRSILTAREKVSPLGQQLMDAANQADPTFDEAASHARFTARNQFTGMGKGALNVQAADRLATHANDLYSLSSQMGGPDLGWSPLSNTAAAVKNSFQQSKTSSYNTILPLIAGELQKMTKNGASTQAETDHIMSQLSPDQPMNVRNAAIKEVVRLADAQFQPLRDSWNSAWAGSTPPPMPMEFNPRTMAIIDAIQNGKDPIPDNWTPPAAGAKPDSSNPFSGLPGKGSGDSGGIGPDPRFEGKRFNDNGQPDPHGDYDAYGRAYGATWDGADSAIGHTSDVKENPDGTWIDKQGRLRAPDSSVLSGWHGPAQGSYEQTLQNELTRQGAGDPTSADNYAMRAAKGGSFSLNDEFNGAMAALKYGLKGQDPVMAYKLTRDLERQRQQQNDAGQGWVGTGLEIGSSVPSALMMGGAPGIPGAMGNGMRFGAVEGFGRGSGLGGSVLSAAGGAVGGSVGGGLGGLIGKYAVAPLARRITNTPLVRSAIDHVTKGNFEPVPNPTPMESAFSKAGPDTASVLDNLQNAKDMGLPYSLADADPRLRLLAGSVARQSPETGAIAENYLDPRQLGQIDRLRQSINDNLAPETNIAERGKSLLSAGNTASSHFYESANMRAAPVDEELKAMLMTRDGQDALQRARSIAENYGRDPNKMGFNLDNQGQVTIENNPSFETLDLIKRGFDAKIEGHRNPLTGALDMQGNPELRALNDYRARFVNKLDSLNPDYPKARAEYAKFAQQKEALDTGYGALPNALPRDVQAAVARATPETLPELQRGYATALSDRAQKLSDTRNPFKAIYGSPAAREKIASVFPGGVPRFDQHYGLENDMAKTVQEVLGGSQTAQRQGMDSAFKDSVTLPAEVISSLHGAPGVGTIVAKGLGYLTRRGIDGASRRYAGSLAPVLFNDASKIDAIGLIQQMLANNAARTDAANLAARRTGLLGSILAPVPALDSR